MSRGQNGNSNTTDMPASESESLVPRASESGAVPPEQTAPRPEDPTVDPAAELDAELSPPRKKPQPKLCGVCGAQPGKYKCPRCSMPYCSVACNKQHKENHPPDLPKPDSADANTNQPDPAQADPYSILLDHRDLFQRLFTRYPTLAAELTRIQETTLPPSENASSQFSFLGRANINGSNRQPQPWTKDVGLRRGAEALRKARTNPTETGDGVREFCEVVRYLLNQRREGVEKVREDVVAEETRVIERLLREEGG